MGFQPFKAPTCVKFDTLTPACGTHWFIAPIALCINALAYCVVQVARLGGGGPLDTIRFCRLPAPTLLAKNWAAETGQGAGFLDTNNWTGGVTGQSIWTALSRNGGCDGEAES